MKRILSLMAAGVLFPLFADGEPPCPALDTVTIKECGQLPFADAARIGPQCAIARRLVPFAAYLREKSKPCSSLVADFIRRYTTLTDTATCSIDTANVQWIGVPQAPVSLVMYISMSCPYCKQVYAQLYDSCDSRIDIRKLLRVGIKHLTVTRFDRMLAATAFLGKQPAFLRTFAPISERISDQVARRIADSIGIDFDSLKMLVESPEVTKHVADSRAEALRNGVTLTPTLFLNNRRYRSYSNARWVIDAARYEVRKKSLESRK
ncbi:MAG: thioredoxin domain-containing protein [Chitinispirillaceae bacterium]|nr:thioredoxin domain-containing protein [Chitinispirillaceae bacterium]